MDFQVPIFIQEIEEMPPRQAIDVKKLEQKRKIEREDRTLTKLLATDCVYDKGLFNITYFENAFNQKKNSVSYSIQKFHPKKESTLTPMEEIHKLEADGNFCFFVCPTVKFFIKGTIQSIESHTITFKLIGNLAERVNAGEELVSDEVYYLLKKEYPFLNAFSPYAVIAGGDKALYLMYTFADNILNRKKDVKSLYLLLSDFCGMPIVNTDEIYDIPFPCPNTKNKNTGKICKIYWDQRYKIRTLATFIALNVGVLSSSPIKKITYYENGSIKENESITDFHKYWLNKFGSEFLADNPEYSEPMSVYKNKGSKKKKDDFIGFANNINTDISKMNFWTFCTVINHSSKYEHKSIHTVNDVDYSKTPGKFLRDLRTIFEERNGNMKGMEKAFIYHMTLTLIWCKANNAEIRTIIKEYNKKMKHPLTDETVKQIVDARIKNRGKEHISAKKIAAELKLSDAFILNRAKICYNRERILARKRKVSQKVNEYRKKQVALKRKTKYDALKKAYLAGGNYKDMETASGWSRNTVKKYLKMILMDQKKKYEKWKLRQEMKTENIQRKYVPQSYKRIAAIIEGAEDNVWIAKFAKQIISL